MAEYKVAEKFVSINGEGTKAGQLAVFIRFTGCNLNCSYCDTKWANQPDVPYEKMSADEIISYILSTGVKNVTLTGGEPLKQPDIYELLEKIAKTDSILAEIETNGSVPLGSFDKIKNRPSFTMDYKLPSSDMNAFMNTDNFKFLRKKDTVKFVAGSNDDLKKAYEIIKKYNLTDICSVYISPVFGKIEPVQIVEFMTEKKLNDVNLQLQLHKIIWDPDKKGV